MSWLTALARPEIIALDAYRSARSEYLGTDLVQLDANESSSAPYGSQFIDLDLNRYPEPQPTLLKHKLAELYQVQPEQLLITRGMDEGIDLLIRALCKPYQDNIIITPPTFGYYEVAARINGVGVTRCPLIAAQHFQPDWSTLAAVNHEKIIFLCNPNNPTGSLLSLQAIEEVCLGHAEKAIIAVDEAYVEFSGQKSATTLLERCDNLVVLRTLSKAYALAGARVGAVIASPAIIALLRKIISPYPLPSPSISAALDALSPVGLAYSKRRINEMVKVRDELLIKLQKLPNLIAAYPSHTNFILIQLSNAADSFRSLKNQGILVRDRSAEVANSLRITVGSTEENNLLLAALGLIPAYTTSFGQGCCKRRTNETDVLVELTLDDLGQAEIKTGIGYFDHMLLQIARHSGVSLFIQVQGDLHVDQHHTIEDVALCLGSALKQALGNKKGIQRYGFVLPMDESLAQVTLDLSGRGFSQCNAAFQTPMLGDFPTEMVAHFFQSLALNLGAAIHITVNGENTHHMVESCFKCFARALKQAITIEGQRLPSSKGVL